MIKKLLYTFVFLSSFIALSQTTIKGTVFNEYLEPFPGTIISSPSGATTSNFDGEFTLIVKKFPVTITISSIGYSSEEIEVLDINQDLSIILKEYLMLDQVVISASRTPERVLESPVTIERIGVKDIKRTASPNFFQSLENLKGIDVLGDSYNVKAVVSNRGFGSTLNNSFIQLVDGAETSVPVLDFSLGNAFGLNELDVQNVEILPGAASALYGANAFNGILLMTSKNPFDYEGISVSIKSGVTTQDGRTPAPFYDTGIRMATKFNDFFAAKVNFGYSVGEEWMANDLRNSAGGSLGLIPGDRNDIGYNGVNVYGDETAVGLDQLALAAAAVNPQFGAYLASQPQLLDEYRNYQVARTGYTEQEILQGDTKSKSLKFDVALHFKPFKNNEDTELILASKFLLLDNLLHGANRYKQNNGYQEQFRAELKGKNYFVRGYFNRNKTGDNWDMRIAAANVNEAWKDTNTYFGDFSTAFFGLTSPLNPNQLSTEAALPLARDFAEQGRIEPGTPEFANAINNAKNIKLNEGGAKLEGGGSYFNGDVNWNLQDQIDFAKIIVGGSYRKFFLNSNGTVYTDDNETISYSNYGAYAQIQKKILDDRLKLTGTIRFDKSDNFEGNFSPRVSISYAGGEKKQHNFRFAFQTGFRNPTTQEQYIGLNLGSNVILMGTAADNLPREIITLNPINGPARDVSGVDAIENSYTGASVFNFLGTGDPSVLEKSNVELVKPETLKSFELGYRGTLNIGSSLFEFDMVGFYNIYEDFVSLEQVFVPYAGDVGSSNPAEIAAGVNSILNRDLATFILRTNSDEKTVSYGFTAGLSTKLDGFNVGANYAFADYKLEDGVIDDSSFGVPKHKVKVQFGHDKLFENFGFGINARWQQGFEFRSYFNDIYIDERIVLDAQVNYRFPAIKSTLKIGGANLLGKNYTSFPGSGIIGSQYYISWTIND